MTITDAIKEVLKSQNSGLTAEEIYNLIVKSNLYQFGAQSPVNVVNIQIRRHCLGIDFPTASNKKLFKIIKTVNRKNYYALLDTSETQPSSLDSVDQGSQSIDILPEEQIMSSYKEYLKTIKIQLIEKILSNDSWYN